MEKPAGFWIRFLAYIIDFIIVGIPTYIIQFIITSIFVVGAVSANPGGMTEEEYTISYLIFGVMPMIIISVILGSLYYGLLTASKMQGTLGKKILGLKVVNEQGGRVSVGQGIGRYFAYILSGIIFYIGFIMVAFGQKKGLHDIICQTRVVYK
ncbi:RDD family protein [Bacillus atrophaeus]|uniref:RDD family protein n=1 Tax=Bacillus atrophaeus TaxID=1452 RepID=UPI00227E0350|nr:RDD family protein [Bacillus atrophaeus]MCY8913338.1 RDD family protein [Bacillus atrophaeus]MCY9113704.1 RDD family protein [Bacillus atrophaeus]MEC0925938.1 RDD family protein [Bacillus atrophaeus]MEC0933910.1 RDD family protein [Bacillus atrophaeus]